MIDIVLEAPNLRNAPAAVWTYKLVGYQGQKKGSPNREAKVLGRRPMLDEVQHFMNSARRIWEDTGSGGVKGV